MGTSRFSPGRAMASWNMLCAIVAVYFLSLLSGATALAQRPQNDLSLQQPLASGEAPEQSVNDELPHPNNRPSEGTLSDSLVSVSLTLRDLLNALNVMQREYFQQWQGTWPTSIDWTAAVIGTQVSAALSSLTATPNNILAPSFSSIIEEARDLASPASHIAIAFENMVNRYFDHTLAFYFGENAFSLRNQAFDDMLWVVLGWLENIKFQDLHSELRYSLDPNSNSTLYGAWHGVQFRAPAAHRARLFYELAAQGWDTSLCDGGMVWSPYLTPYKNAITNELFISASIGMYIYFPGDPIDSPFLASDASVDGLYYERDPAHLEAAVKGYQWLKDSHMIGHHGLYADGFHISGWRNADEPGSGKCDELNRMVYTYNQGVILSGLRGLWLATGTQDYLRDGHDLILKVIMATGWPKKQSTAWAGLGRGGVLEEVCDSDGGCSQNSHTFKGIFFNHFAEFCRPLSPHEERFIAELSGSQPEVDRRLVFEWHQARCRSYRSWLEHNAEAALMTRDNQGKFGMWWGRRYPDDGRHAPDAATLPYGADDYRNDQKSRAVWGPTTGTRESRSLADPFAFSNGQDATALLDKKRYTPSAGKTSRHSSSQRRSSTDGRMDRNQDVNDRRRGRTVETQSGGVAILRALYQWKTSPSLS
ncbi:glycosyl hydrolase [Paecilomyces variotii No. 5]|uniref:Glycosyl hydrolase n=1 Tax=Byssochlamys spectabilis (strain No. 5 / NBRC 109023) TaxID=1356009 RepID=V5HUS6_BYSSN|nr:glycosyl hydrolase [Paecilomyces variotii No. 5]